NGGPLRCRTQRRQGQHHADAIRGREAFFKRLQFQTAVSSGTPAQHGGLNPARLLVAKQRVAHIHPVPPTLPDSPKQLAQKLHGRLLSMSESPGSGGGSEGEAYLSTSRGENVLNNHGCAGWQGGVTKTPPLKWLAHARQTKSSSIYVLL